MFHKRWRYLTRLLHQLGNEFYKEQKGIIIATRQNAALLKECRVGFGLAFFVSDFMDWNHQKDNSKRLTLTPFSMLALTSRSFSIHCCETSKAMVDALHADTWWVVRSNKTESEFYMVLLRYALNDQTDAKNAVACCGWLGGCYGELTYTDRTKFSN